MPMRIKKLIAGLIVGLMILTGSAACAGSSNYDFPELHISWNMTSEEAKKKCTVETTTDESSDRTILTYIRSVKDEKKVSIAGLNLSAFFLMFDENGEMIKMIASFEDQDRWYETASIKDIQKAFTKEYGTPDIDFQTREQMTSFSSYVVYTYGWKTDHFIAIASGSDNALGGSTTVMFYPPTMSLDFEESNP